jgi:hypothetical protein
LVSPTLNFLAVSQFPFSFAKSTTSSLNIALYDYLRTIFFFSPWVTFLGKFLNCKSLRLREHTYFKMEAVSTSTESHNGDDATQDGSNHVTRGMRKKKRLSTREKFKGYLHWKQCWYHIATEVSRYDATGARRSWNYCLLAASVIHAFGSVRHALFNC